MGLLAKGTPAWLLAAPLVMAISAAVTYLLLGALWLLWAHLGLALTLMVPMLFFRDPDRTIGKGIVSPADGKVRSIVTIGGQVRISIFMNVHNVHVNRAPMGGTITRIEHLSGGFVPAFKKESDRNERVHTTMAGPGGRFEVVQIAGTVARRIVPYRKVGDSLEKGDRIGLIRFGSRVDVAFSLPNGHRVLVREGDRVLAGATTLAGRSGKGGMVR